VKGLFLRGSPRGIDGTLRQAITTIRRGLEIPVAGEPVQQIPGTVFFPPAVALLGADFQGLRPGLAVREGERVEAGQVLFSDKNRPGVVFTAPCTATVAEKVISDTGIGCFSAICCS